MNLQELLTYVEELAFKNAMFGYDKDEVDIQLDKICDEVEALVVKKDKEIEELKKAISTGAPIPAEPEIEKAPIAEPEEPTVAAEPATLGIPVQEYAAVVAECDDLKKELAAAKEEAEHANEATRLMLGELQKAQARMSVVESEEHAAKAKLAGLREEIAALKAEIAAMAEAAEEEVTEAPVEDAVEEVTAEVAEAAEEEITEAPVEEIVAEEVPEQELLRAPSNTDEAYTQYMRYADLLCQQLAEVETKHAKIVDTATAEADEIREKAQGEANTILEAAYAVLNDKTAEATNAAEDILSAAKEEAEGIVFNAKSEAENIVNAAKSEADQIGQEYLVKAAEAEENCKVLAEKKASIMESLSGFSADIAALLVKMQTGEVAGKKEYTEEEGW